MFILEVYSVKYTQNMLGSYSQIWDDASHISFAVAYLFY